MKRRIFNWIKTMALALVICFFLGWNKPSLILLAFAIGYVGIDLIDYLNGK